MESSGGHSLSVAHSLPLLSSNLYLYTSTAALQWKHLNSFGFSSDNKLDLLCTGHSLSVGHSLPLLYSSNLPSAKLTSICSDFFGQEIEHAAGVYRAQNVRHQEVIDTSYEFVTLPPHPHIHCDIVDYIPVAVLQWQFIWIFFWQKVRFTLPRSRRKNCKCICVLACASGLYNVMYSLAFIETSIWPDLFCQKEKCHAMQWSRLVGGWAHSSVCRATNVLC